MVGRWNGEGLGAIERKLAELDVLVELDLESLPTEVIESTPTMATLGRVCTRLAHVDKQYEPLRQLVRAAFSDFARPMGTADGAAGHDTSETDLPRGVACEAEHAVVNDDDSGCERAGQAVDDDRDSGAQPSSAAEVALKARFGKLTDYVDGLPKNVALRERLQLCGYRTEFWKPGAVVVERTVQRSGGDEGLRASLSAVYDQLVPLLRSAGVFTVAGVVVGDRQFDATLSVDELKSRRAAAVRAIQAAAAAATRGGSAAVEASTAAVSAVLAEEQRVETEWAEAAGGGRGGQGAAKMAKLAATLAHSVFDVDCSHVAGCYQPTGCHAEKPLEVGLRADMTMLSITDESGAEIENAELLLCDEALFVFKAYSTGHSWDTSPLYVGVIETLLAAPLVPAVVVPEGFPKPSVFDVLCEHFASVPRGTVLTAEYDWSDEWKSYHDFRPVECRVGVDLYVAPDPSTAPIGAAASDAGRGSGSNASVITVTSGVSGGSSGGGGGGGSVVSDCEADVGRTRAGSRAQSRDASLDTIVAKRVMEQLLADPDVKQFAFMGRDLARYVGDRLAVDNSDRHVAAADTFAARFDFDRWRRRGQGVLRRCCAIDR
jgi:hypothetical protein